MEIFYPIVLINTYNATLWNGACMEVIIVAPARSVAAVSYPSRPSYTSILASGIVVVATIVFVVVLSILTVVADVSDIMAHMIFQLVYIFIQIINHPFILNILI